MGVVATSVIFQWGGRAVGLSRKKTPLPSLPVTQPQGVTARPKKGNFGPREFTVPRMGKSQGVVGENSRRIVRRCRERPSAVIVSPARGCGSKRLNARSVLTHPSIAETIRRSFLTRPEIVFSVPDSDHILLRTQPCVRFVPSVCRKLAFSWSSACAFRNRDVVRPIIKTAWRCSGV